MKWEIPALASVSSREPAPIQKPSATERTLGIRSEMTRSPESSSERTYSCTPALSLAGPGDSLGQCRNESAVGFEQTVDQLVDVGQGQLRRRMRIEHGGVIALGEVVDQPVVHNASVAGKGLAGLESVHDARSVLIAP